jgi:hypothetical protein
MSMFKTSVWFALIALLCATGVGVYAINNDYDSIKFGNPNLGQLELEKRRAAE